MRLPPECRVEGLARWRVVEAGPVFLRLSPTTTNPPSAGSFSLSFWQHQQQSAPCICWLNTFVSWCHYLSARLTAGVAEWHSWTRVCIHPRGVADRSRWSCACWQEIVSQPATIPLKETADSSGLGKSYSVLVRVLFTLRGDAALSGRRHLQLAMGLQEAVRCWSIWNPIC